MRVYLDEWVADGTTATHIPRTTTLDNEWRIAMIQNLYSAYLTADFLNKKIARAGGKLAGISIYPDGTVWASLEDNYVDHTYDWYGDERLAEMRAEREAFILAFLDVAPGAYADRADNIVSLYGEAHSHRFRIRVGEALCERVEVGEKTVEKIDPNYLVDAPKVTVVEKVYEYRCSDDILGSMAHKADA